MKEILKADTPVSSKGVVKSKRKFVPDFAKTIPEQAELKFHGVIFDVYQWPQEMFDGSVQTFEMLGRPDTVKILAVLSEEEAKQLKNAPVSKKPGPKIIITKQEQPRKDCFYDYPGGRMDAEDADELTAAKRELLEETGLKMRDWKLIRVEQPFSKTDWLVYTFLATGLEGQTTQSLDAGEKIELIAMSFNEAVGLAKTPESRFLEEEFDSLEKLQAMPELYKY